MDLKLWRSFKVWVWSPHSGAYFPRSLSWWATSLPIHNHTTSLWQLHQLLTWHSGYMFKRVSSFLKNRGRWHCPLPASSHTDFAVTLSYLPTAHAAQLNAIPFLLFPWTCCLVHLSPGNSSPMIALDPLAALVSMDSSHVLSSYKAAAPTVRSWAGSLFPVVFTSLLIDKCQKGPF